MSAPGESVRVDRRTAIKWVAGAAALLRLPSAVFDGTAAAAQAAGYGKDPDLLKIYAAGNLWPLTFTNAQRQLAAALCDLIIPADGRSPAASSVGVVDFLDEWISAPYPDHRRDRQLIVNGMQWLDAESQRRFGQLFAAVSDAQRGAICHDIASLVPADARFAEAAAFFRRYRGLTAGGFYTTAVGMKDLQYVGNVPLTAFEGPPVAVLKLLGLA